MSYKEITPSGRDTATPESVARRTAIVSQNLSGLRGFDFLDAGCGAGDYCSKFEEEFGAKVIGIEYEEEKVAEAQKLGRPYVSVGNLEKLDFADSSFDVILINEVLEHVGSEAATISELQRVLRPGGSIHVFSPNRFYPLETHAVYSHRTGKKICKFFPLLPWLPSSIASGLVRLEARNFWPWTLRKLFADQGFNIESTDYLWQTFENISGESPELIQFISPPLRVISGICQKLPLIKTFGVSQYFVARKPLL